MFSEKTATTRERFVNTMEYKPVDRIPNYEFSPWNQVIDRFEKEGLNRYDICWNWETGDEYFQMDPREYINVNYGMLPPFETVLIEKTDRYEIFRNEKGIVVKGLLEGISNGGRASMDQYLSHPVNDIGSFREIKKRYVAGFRSRYPAMWKDIMLPRWKNRDHTLILGINGSTSGFYWRAREWMGTTNLSYALYDQPELVHEMMEFIEDFLIEVSRPILEHTDIDYMMINEDMSMKTGPLISPQQYRTFIFPHMQRLVDFLKGQGVRYVAVDTDGNCEALIPLFMDAGVDAICPLERVAGMDPVGLRKKYGRSLRLWGGVDKMEIARGGEVLENHLAALVPLVEEGGFIPHIDHGASPDISLENFKYYMKRKLDLLQGKF